LVTWAKCFLEGCWEEYPDAQVVRMFAQLDPAADFTALGYAALAIQPIPSNILKRAAVPVLVLNGGADDGASDQWDITPFIPGAQRAVAGNGDHGTAYGDPVFQAELVRFLLG
jgi:hypothetical protein